MMKLNIINNETRIIPEKLGISHDRSEELFVIVEQEYNKVCENFAVAKLVSHYAALAAACNNIEEYTVCMHAFILNISRIGKPSDSREVIN